jgi:hypothetical protein
VQNENIQSFLQIFNVFANECSIRHQDFPDETPFVAPTPLRYVREIQRAMCTVCEVSMKIGRFSIEILEFKNFSMNSKRISDHVYSNFHSNSAKDLKIFS